MECSDATSDCFGVTMGYQAANDNGNYVDEFITMIQTASGSSAVTAKTDMATSVLKGKQRNVFGSYLVYNLDLD